MSASVNSALLTLLVLKSGSSVSSASRLAVIDLDVAVEEALNLQIGDSAFQVEPEFLGNEAADPTALPSESLYKLSNP